MVKNRQQVAFMLWELKHKGLMVLRQQGIKQLRQNSIFLLLSRSVTIQQRLLCRVEAKGIS
jgi:hypothetical protein